MKGRKFYDDVKKFSSQQVLAGKTSASLNIYNKQGYTPLHMACLADAPDCVRALILSGADVNLSAAEKRTVVSASYTIPGEINE